MALNPIIHLFFAVISGVIGFILLSKTDSWLILIPCLIFTLLFFVSLALPGMTGSSARRRTAPKARSRIETSNRPARMNEVTIAGDSSPSNPSVKLEKVTPTLLRAQSRPPQGLDEIGELPPADRQNPRESTISVRT